MGEVNLELLMSHVMRHRARRGQSQREVAAELGLSASTVCRVEQGQAPDLASFSKLCRWLGRDPAVYLGGVRKKLVSSEREEISSELSWMLSSLDVMSPLEVRTRLESLERVVREEQP